jgi:hypothetical protein
MQSMSLTQVAGLAAAQVRAGATIRTIQNANDNPIFSVRLMVEIMPIFAAPCHSARGEID